MNAVRRWGLLLVALVLTAGACSAQNPEAVPAADDTFVIGLPAEFDHLNPILGYAPTGGSLIFDELLRRDASLNMVPALATELPTVSEDGTTITFTLRDDVTFHDGEPLTSEDVVFTYESILDEQVDSEIRGDFVAIESVEAPDDTTVVFHLAYPYPPLVKRMTVGIVPAHAFEGESPNDAAFNTAPVGTGPYRFSSWTPGEKIQLEANPDYWGGAPAIKHLVLALTTDDNARATRLAAGELDATVLPPKAAERFRDTENMTVHEVPTADYRAVTFPMEHPVTGDPAIRKAVSLAVNRQAMVDSILAGTGRPAFGPISPDTKWYNAAVTGPESGDPAAAKQLLEEAGWTVGPDGIRVKDGQPARFTLLYPAGDTLRKELALTVASDAKRVGIDIRTEGLTWDAIDPRMASDAVLFGGGQPYDPDYVLYNLFHSSRAGQGYANPGLYRNATVDQLLDKGRRTADEQARTRIYDQVQERVFADMPWAFLVFLEHVYVVRGQWDGIQPAVEGHEHATGGFFGNIHQWTPAA